LGECHYLDGNHKALARAEAIKIALETLGMDSQRFSIQWCSSAEAPRFAKLITEFTEEIRKLGPNTLGKKAARTA